MEPSGFLAPTLFNDEIYNFFRIANIGPAITGQFIQDNRGRLIPDNNTLQVTNIPLNSCLFFTMPQINDQPNPLYKIISVGLLTPLFTLHAYYSNMRIFGNNTRLSASNEMRRYLRETMISAIKLSAQYIIQKNINNVQIIDQVLNTIPMMISAIDDPTLYNNQVLIGGREMFNPNFFLYAHFSSLISSARIKILTKDELQSLQKPTIIIYENIIPFNYDISFGEQFIQVEDGDYVSIIIKYQQNIISLARTYKNITEINDLRRNRILFQQQQNQGLLPQ